MWSNVSIVSIHSCPVLTKIPVSTAHRPRKGVFPRFLQAPSCQPHRRRCIDTIDTIDIEKILLPAHCGREKVLFKEISTMGLGIQLRSIYLACLAGVILRQPITTLPPSWKAGTPGKAATAAARPYCTVKVAVTSAHGPIRLVPAPPL